MALLRVFDVTRYCSLTDPRGGEILRMFPGKEYNVDIPRHWIELVKNQLKILKQIDHIDYLLGEHPAVDDDLEIASIADISNVAVSKQSYYVASIGTGGTFSTLAAALADFGAAESRRALFFPVATQVPFGTSNITTTKPVEIRDLYGGGPVEIQWGAGSGVWTYNAPTLILQNCKLKSLAGNTGGRIVTANTDFHLIVKGQAEFLSQSTYPVIDIPASTLTLFAFDSHIRAAGNVAVKAFDLFAWLRGSTLKKNGLEILQDPWSMLSYDANCSLDDDFNVVTFEPVTDARYINYHVGTTSPTANDDKTKYFQPGCQWLDISAQRRYYCVVNDVGAAEWQPAQVMIKGNGDPNGSITGNFGDEFYDELSGKLYKCVSFPSGTLWGEFVVGGEQFVSELRVLSSGDITNKYVILVQTPKSVNKVRVTVLRGGYQLYNYDFLVDAANLQKIKWDGLFLETVLETNDILMIDYFI